MLKWLIIVFAIIVIVMGGVWYFQRGKSNAPQYQAMTVERGDLTQVVTATGTLNPVVNVTVGSQVSGRISKLNVDFNSVVKSNEVIAEIDPSTYQGYLEQAQGIWQMQRRIWNCSRPRRRAAQNCLPTS